VNEGIAEVVVEDIDLENIGDDAAEGIGIGAVRGGDIDEGEAVAGVEAELVCDGDAEHDLGALGELQAVVDEALVKEIAVDAGHLAVGIGEDCADGDGAILIFGMEDEFAFHHGEAFEAGVEGMDEGIEVFDLI